MKRCHWLFIFVFWSICSLSQNTTLTIKTSEGAALGATVYINGKVKAIADEYGKAQLSNLQHNDTIQVSYIGYKPTEIIYSSLNKELEINLTPEIFEIGEVQVASVDGRHLFRKMMKRNLQVATLHSTPFCLIDTLLYASVPDEIYRQCTGKFSYPLKGSIVTRKKASTKLLDSTSENGKKFYLSRKADNLYGNNYQDPARDKDRCYDIECRDIESCLTTLYALTNLNNNMKFSYLGKDSTGYNLFHFYIPDNKWIHNFSKMKGYRGGIIYLNGEGIIKKIQDHKTALNPVERSFERTIDVFYDTKYNELIPYRVSLQNYFLDEGLNVILTRKAYLEIYSKAVVVAGIIIPNDK